MRAVLLQSGDIGIPMRVEFMMTQDDLVNALAWQQRNFDEEEEGGLPRLSRERVVELVRDTLYESGAENSAYWPDHVYSAPRRDAIAAWAREHVTRVFGPVLDTLR